MLWTGARHRQRELSFIVIHLMDNVDAIARRPSPSATPCFLPRESMDLTTDTTMGWQVLVCGSCELKMRHRDT